MIPVGCGGVKLAYQEAEWVCVVGLCLVASGRSAVEWQQTSSACGERPTYTKHKKRSLAPLAGCFGVDRGLCWRRRLMFWPAAFKTPSILTFASPRKRQRA